METVVVQIDIQHIDPSGTNLEQLEEGSRISELNLERMHHSKTNSKRARVRVCVMEWQRMRKEEEEAGTDTMFRKREKYLDILAVLGAIRYSFGTRWRNSILLLEYRGTNIDH